MTGTVATGTTPPTTNSEPETASTEVSLSLSLSVVTARWGKDESLENSFKRDWREKDGSEIGGKTKVQINN